MVLGWPVGATVGVRVGFKRFGVRAVLRVGGVLVPLGSLVFLVLNRDSSPIVAGLGSLVVGLGMGLSSSASIILIQEIVDWSERGSVTASYLFARSLGSTFGATVFGAVLNFGLLRSGQAGASSDQLRQLLERASEAAGDPGLRAALEQSLHLTFVSMFAIALMVAAAAFLVPKVSFAPRRGARRVNGISAAFARFSPTATASVIARQKVADSERNEPKSLSTTSNRTSARPASGESALSVIATIGHAGAPRAFGEVDGERRIGREADRDQRVAGARLRQLLPARARPHCR